MTAIESPKEHSPWRLKSEKEKQIEAQSADVTIPSVDRWELSRLLRPDDITPAVHGPERPKISLDPALCDAIGLGHRMSLNFARVPWMPDIHDFAIYATNFT